MTLAYEYTTRVEFTPGIWRHNILLRCQPAQTAFQRSLSERFSISEGFWYKENKDGFGNRIISGGTVDWHSGLEYSCSGTVECDTYCIPDANPHPMYFMPSRLTIPTLIPLKLGRDNAEMGADDFLDVCLDIMHQVHNHISYEPNTTHILTTAEEVYCSRKGVCQDFAHLMVALCRKAGLAARYVCGLMSGEGATHAWVEVHDGQCWYAFDPTNDTAIASGYIKIAHGRDALDCPVSRGTYLGITLSVTNVKCEVTTKN